MLNQFYAKNPVHPLAAIFGSLLALIVGMICSRTVLLFAYIALLAILFLAYGCGMAVLTMGLGMGFFGIVAGGISALINRTLDMFWITPARCLLIGICVVPMLSVPPALLTRCLNQLHFPRMLSLGMLITLRFLPTVYSEIHQIREAMRTRGIDTRLTSPRWYRPSNLYRAFLVPLVMRLVGMSDTLALSVETRAFTGDGRNATVWKPVHFTPRDGIWIALLCLIAASLIAARSLGL